VDALTPSLPISFDEVSVTIGAVTILDRVTLALVPGAPTVLLGPNGAGKTTLLHAAMGLAVPTRGRITWGAHADSRWTRRAIVLQRPTMLRRSVNGNIRYALRTAGMPRRRRQEAVDELLSMVGLLDLARRPARRLSGGEQQRLALARALAQDPAVLFLDEPTASLDPSATQAVEAVIAAASRRGIKVVLATHDLGEARRLAGDVVLLHRGRVVEAGDAISFFERPQTHEGRRFIAGELLV
jgi:tungstate transport system ATP-binding protein